MYKVLISDSNEKEILDCFEYLSTKNRNLNLYKMLSGKETLDTYVNLEPNILILNTSLKDMSGVEVLDKLSMSIEERKKCNTIIIANNQDEQLKIKNASKVYKILSKPYEFEELSKTVEIMCQKDDYSQLSPKYLDIYLLTLGFCMSSNGTLYMKTAIQIGFCFPYYLSSLGQTIKYIAKEYSVTESTVKNALVASLKPLNNNLVYSYDKKSLYNLFNKNKNVSTKEFIQISVSYLKVKQLRKK